MKTVLFVIFTAIFGGPDPSSHGETLSMASQQFDSREACLKAAKIIESKHVSNEVVTTICIDGDGNEAQ